MTKYSIAQIHKFLLEVDDNFNTPLSKKQNLLSLAEKFQSKATVCAVEENGEIVAMAAGYTEDLLGNMAYISVVATLVSCRGKGYATACIKEFLDISKTKNIDAVHLYTDKNNTAAVAMYKKLGFFDFKIPDEPRPQDIHLICFLNQEK